MRMSQPVHATVAQQFINALSGAEIMSGKTPSGTQAHSDHKIRDAGKRFGKHVLAIVAGFIMTIAGLGMGVTIVLLPLGIPVGLVGVLLLSWGLFEWSKTR